MAPIPSWLGLDWRMVTYRAINHYGLKVHSLED